MFSSCFPGARLDLSDEDNVVALVLAKCSARPYAELIKSNIPSSSSLMSARSSASRPSPPFALGVSSLGPASGARTFHWAYLFLRLGEWACTPIFKPYHIYIYIYIYIWCVVVLLLPYLMFIAQLAKNCIFLSLFRKYLNLVA